MPDWDANNAATIFNQMLVKTNNNIQGVIAANDNIAGAVIADLKAKHLKPIPLSRPGRDASQGVQYIIAGWQTGTVYKYVPDEANAAAAAAVALLKGQKPKTNGDPARTARKSEPTLALPVVWITKANYTRLFTDKFLKKSDVCVGDVQAVLQVAITHDRGGGAPRGASTAISHHDRMSDDTPLLQLRGHHEDVRLGAGADRRRLRGAARRGDGARRRQRRRQVDARSSASPAPTPPTAARSSSRARRCTSTGRRTRPGSGSRSSTRISRSATTSTSSRTCTSAARSTGAQILNEAAMEQHTAATLKSLAVTTISSIRQPVATLSGGQRQSVAVAKAVQWNSKLVILDEPTAALGVAQTEQVLALVRRLGEQGLGGR